MRCARCGFEDTKVLESRVSTDGCSVRRRRFCTQCKRRYTTYEKEEDFVFQIRKKDERIEPYIRDKALRSIQIACQKRHLKIEELESLLTKVENLVFEKAEKIISSKCLGDMLMAELYALDLVAYVRFASVYKDFKDPYEFHEILQGLDKIPTNVYKEQDCLV